MSRVSGKIIFDAKLSGSFLQRQRLKVFDKQSQFQLWHDVCYLSNPCVRNKSYIRKSCVR